MLKSHVVELLRILIVKFSRWNCWNPSSSQDYEKPMKVNEPETKNQCPNWYQAWNSSPQAHLQKPTSKQIFSIIELGFLWCCFFLYHQIENLIFDVTKILLILLFKIQHTNPILKSTLKSQIPLIIGWFYCILIGQ